MPPERVVRILRGPLRGWRWITGSAPHGCWLGTYERDSQQAFVQRVHAGDVIYDIGANAGFFTLLASKLSGARGAVYSFEPLPRNVEYLERHIALNRCANVHVQRLAITSREGTAHFAVAQCASMGGLSECGEIVVETRSLDDLVKEGTPAPHFMKIDVEGAEADVLTGAAGVLRDSRPTILLSTHGWQQHQRCCELLQSAGYEIDLLRDGTADGNYMLLALPGVTATRGR